MKRILPLILALVAGMAQADSNSDYRAGSDFARQIQGQGTGSIQGFKPQESIPSYNANPDETKYYGGVTAGGDGGLKNDGTTEWATGETGKTITESFMNKPKDILSPDAPFIQTGRDVVNRADSIVGNTGQQCSAQEINRSEFTNYTCERDTMVEEYCTRTASITGDWKYTDEYREVTIPHSQFRFSMNGLKLVFSVTAPVTGTVESASLSVYAAFFFLNSRYTFMNTTFNVGLANGQSDTYPLSGATGLQVTQGQVLTGSGCTANGNCLPHGNGDRKVYESLVSGASTFTLKLRMKVRDKEWVPRVEWVESCPFNKADGVLTGTECSEPGGTKTGVMEGIASAWNSLSQFGSNRGSSDSVTGGADSTMSAQDSMMASRMRSAVESYAKAHNISNEQATQELASRSTRASAGMYGDAHAEWGVKPKILGVGGGLGVRGGGRAGIDWEDNDAHTASSNTQSSHNARHDIDARATQDFKEASDYFTSRKVSESGSHTDNNADSRVDQLSAALNSAKQSYDQYTTNMTRSHEYAEMASRTESMSGQMSEDLSQQFAQYVMKHAPQDAEAILTNTSSPEIAERRRAMAWSFVQEQVQPGVDNAWRESRGDIGKGMESVPSGGGSQDIIADHQGHQAIIDQRTQDSNIRNDVKHQVDNMVTEYKGNIGDTQNSVRGEENIVRGQYSELQNHHKTEALSQNNKYNEEKSAQERMPGADSPQELMKRAKEYQDKYKQ